MKDVLENGYDYNGNFISVSIRLFTCDTPARAFLRGVFGHTSFNGCGKCCTVGYRHPVSRATVFPNFSAEKRTDANFRAGIYKYHQKIITPLLELPIDIVKDFVIGDVLHLIDLGITRRLLEGYRLGSLTNADAKWSTFYKMEINRYLTSIRGPIEIRTQRAIRSFDEIAHWKGREYRIFLLYLSIPIFQFSLPLCLFEHFLLYFCGITIFSNKHHLDQYMEIGENCIEYFLDAYKKLYGEEYIASNLHNLSHLADDVRRFGVLDSFSTYPFESLLCRIKRLLKTGSSPLTQVAKRIIERDTNSKLSVPIQKRNDPELKINVGYSDLCPQSLKCINDFASGLKFNLFMKVNFESFSINCSSEDDKWVLLKNNNIFKIFYVIRMVGRVYICGKKVRDVECIFNLPFPSKYLYMFECKDTSKLMNFEVFPFEDIVCKFFKLNKIIENEDDDNVSISSDDNLFVPILHTINM